jgi:broad specificity phosphatase PhoE
MTTFYLVRHGANDFLGHALAGRLPDIHLNDAGQREARRIAERLQAAPITHVISSPQERCRETAQALAAALDLEIEISAALNEVDFGEWQGATMSDLAGDERWSKWNSFRTGHVIPGGETMIAIQARMADEMIRLKNKFPGEHIALFSHGDPLRAVLCYWLGMPLDFIQRLEIAPGSISEVAVDADTAIVRRMNVL